MQILRFLFTLVLIGVTTQVIPQAEYAITTKANHPFEEGEILEYKLDYGWFTIGKATFVIDGILEYQGRPCYNVEVTGNSAGLLNVFTTVDDKWQSYVQVADLTPLFASRDIKEGRYQLEEQVYIDQETGEITVEAYRPHKQKRKPTKNYKFDTKTRMYDMLSGMLMIRSSDFSAMQAGDTVRMDAFFEDTFYDFRIIYAGREEVKTKVGKLKAHKIIPVMPDNAVFNGENSIVAWFSDDPNQIPLKVTANMFIGKASCEITRYRNIKYGPDSK